MDMKARCSLCFDEADRPGQRYCKACHNAYARLWKQNNPLKGEARRRAVVRWTANGYKRRGKLKPEPCQECGAETAEMHHPDYNKPLFVVWMCFPCHRTLHVKERRDLASMPVETDN